MYESYFGLERRPFSAIPDPQCCAGVQTMQQACDELFRCLEGGQGIGILSAPAGTGKTLLCCKLVEELKDSFRTVFLASSNFSTRRSLLQAILYELGFPYSRLDEQELRLELATAVKSAANGAKGVVLVIDEAHLLGERLLEEVRTITNFIEDGQALVRVMLSGHLELEEILAAPGMDALNQRIRAQSTLAPLTRQESVDYIEFRMAWAGGDVFALFSPEAIQLVALASDGNPRCLNQLCDHSMLLAFASENRLVTESIVRESLDDLKQLPLQWNIPESVQIGTEDSVEEAGSWESDETIIPAIEENSNLDSGAVYESGTTETPSFEFGESAVIEVGDELTDSASEQTLADRCIEKSETPQSDSSSPVEHVEEDGTLVNSDEEPVVIEYAVPDGDGWRSLDDVEEKNIEIDDNETNWPVVRDFESENVPTANTGIEEELVVDPYAQIDASESGDSSKARSGTDASDGFAETLRPRPDLIIDSVTPLLEQVLDPAATIEFETSPADAQNRTNIPREEFNGVQIEDEIGAIAMEAYLSMPDTPETASIGDLGQDSLVQPDERADGEDEKSPQVYDIVQPADESDDAKQSTSDDASPKTQNQPEDGRFNQLFSDLRQRRKQA